MRVVLEGLVRDYTAKGNYEYHNSAIFEHRIKLCLPFCLSLQADSKYTVYKYHIIQSKEDQLLHYGD